VEWLEQFSFPSEKGRDKNNNCKSITYASIYHIDEVQLKIERHDVNKQEKFTKSKFFSSVTEWFSRLQSFEWSEAESRWKTAK